MVGAVSTAGQVTPGSALTLADAIRMIADATKDKSYQQLPLGQDVAGYLRFKRKALTPASYVEYENTLHKLVLGLGFLNVEDFAPPVGTERVEEFIDKQWGHLAPSSYNRNLSILHDFFKWAVVRGRLHGDPTVAITRAKKRDVHRTTFATSDVRRILAENENLRDRVALRLLLNYALRKGALRNVQFKHFDHVRKRLTIFTKGGKVRQVPIPDPAFWHDLERLLIDLEAAGDHYLMARQRKTPTGGLRRFPKEAMGGHALHDWWYRCLANAGIVPEGTTSGERMHKARHTAGQRVLDATGNLVAVQKLLGHASIQTTGDVYTDWDIEQLAASIADALNQDDE